jgi:glucose/arabinose dehydrogenase
MRSRAIAAIIAVAVLACGGCAGAGNPAPGGSAQAPGGAVRGTVPVGEPSVLVRNLAVPWAIAFLPDGDALVTERDTARLLRVTPHGTVRTVGTVPGVEPYGEGGLLGVAVSPSFGRDRLVYLYLSTATDNRIVRFRYAGGQILPLDAVVTGIPRAANHKAGGWRSGRTACSGRRPGSTVNPAWPRTGTRSAARSCG